MSSQVNRAFYLPAMEMHELFAARRQAFTAIAEQFKGTKKELAEKVDLSPSYLSRMLKDPASADAKDMGEEVALRIERKLDLEPGALVFPVALHLQVNEPAAEYKVSKLKPGDVPDRVLTRSIGLHIRAIAELANALNVPEREVLAQYTAKMLLQGIDDAALTMLHKMVHGLGEPEVPWLSADQFRKIANQIADEELDGPGREVVTTFLQAVDSRVAEVRMAPKQGEARAPESHDN